MYVSLLHRYVALYSTELIKQQRSSAALELFIKYGAPAKPQNLNIYRHLASEILLEDTNDIKSLIGLRNIFQQLVTFRFYYSIFGVLRLSVYYLPGTEGNITHN